MKATPTIKTSKAFLARDANLDTSARTPQTFSPAAKPVLAWVLPQVLSNARKKRVSVSTVPREVSVTPASCAHLT